MSARPTVDGHAVAQGPLVDGLWRVDGLSPTPAPSLAPTLGQLAAVDATEVALVDAEGARAADRDAVARGASWHGLMATAAGHLARTVIAAAGRTYGLRVAVVVGRGNNGGDGWGAAIRLTQSGAAVEVFCVDDIDTPVSPTAAEFRAAWIDRNGRTFGPRHWDRLARADVIVDAVLGTGATGELRDSTVEAVAAINEARDGGAMVVACDLPTGVDANTGAVAAAAVTADATVTFGAIKRGLLLDPGRRHVGTLVVGGLGRQWQVPSTRWRALTAAGAAPQPWPDWADKWDRGRVLIVAGGPATSGAAILAAHGALVAGAGLVTLAVPDDVASEVTCRVDPGVMVHPIDLAAPAEHTAQALRVADQDAVAIGPGIGSAVAARIRTDPRRAEQVRQLVTQVLATAQTAVVDADALNVLADTPDQLAAHTGRLVVTPHRYELARIGGGRDGADAWQQRTQQVPRLAQCYDAVVVAKGPGTLIAAPDGRVWICPIAAATIGSGGTGDALAGVIAAASATGGDIALSTAKAVWWHAAAGAAAPQATATGLLDALAQQMRHGNASEPANRRRRGPRADQAPDQATDEGVRR